MDTLEFIVGGGFCVALGATVHGIYLLRDYCKNHRRDDSHSTVMSPQHSSPRNTHKTGTIGDSEDRYRNPKYY